MTNVPHGPMNWGKLYRKVCTFVFGIFSATSDIFSKLTTWKHISVS